MGGFLPLPPVFIYIFLAEKRVIFLAENRGIEYNPNIFYELDEAPANSYRRLTIKSENYTTASENQKKIEDVKVNIDFLIKKAEDELKEYEGFTEYKPAAVKKYYCNQFVDVSEENNIKTFENKLSKIDGNLAVDYYKRLLSLKKETDNDLEAIGELMLFEAQSLKEYIQSLSRNFELEKDYLDIIYRQGVIDNAKEKLNVLNDIFIELEDKEERLKCEFKEASKNHDADRARAIQFEIEKIKREINRVKNSLGYTASHSHSLYRKIEKTDDFVKKIGYMVIASPYDNLDGTVCCLLKVFLKKTGVGLTLEEIEAGLEKLDIKELKDAVNAIRAILAMSFNKTSDVLARIENEIIDILTAPLKALLGKSISILRDLELSVFKNLYILFDSEEEDFNNPDSILDCIYLEELMDLVWDKMEEIFEDIENNLLDLYRVIHQQIDLYDEDSLKLFEKAKIKALYDMLTKFSVILNTIEDFSIKQGVEQWIEGFLIESGFGTYYDNEAGVYKTVNVGGCISPFDYDGSYRSFVPESPFDIPRIEFARNKEYQDWLAEGQEIVFSCSIENQKVMDENRLTLDKINSDVLLTAADISEYSKKYIEEKGLNY